METKPIYRQMEEYLDYCKNIRRMSSMTINNKDHTYKHFIVGSELKDLRELDNAAMNKWISYQSERGVSARTINMRMAHILAMLRYFREMGMDMPIKLPLVRKLKEEPARRIFYTRQQIEKVLAVVEDDMTWLLIRIAFDTGLRIGELRNMRLENVHDRRIKFVGKGRKDRESYMSQEARDRLTRYIEEYDITDWLWVRRSYMPYSVDELRIKMRKAFHDAGHTDFYPHALRHSFGSDIQLAGAELMEIQQMMGHADASTTQRYLHGLEGRLESFFVKYKDRELTHV